MSSDIAYIIKSNKTIKKLSTLYSYYIPIELNPIMLRKKKIRVFLLLFSKIKISSLYAILNFKHELSTHFKHITILL